MLVELFGEERVPYGVSRPFGRTLESMKAALKAFRKGTELSEKVMHGKTARLISPNA